MSTSKKQTFRSLINRLFFRKAIKQNEQTSHERIVKSIPEKDLKHNHSPFHGEDEAFLFI